MKRLARILYARKQGGIRRLGNSHSASLGAASGAVCELAIEWDAERSIRIEPGLEQQRPLAREMAHYQLAVFALARQHARVAGSFQDRAGNLGTGLAEVKPPGHVQLGIILGGAM